MHISGAVYVEDAIMRTTGVVSFINNSAGSAGGALIGSPRSFIDIRSEKIIFWDNMAVVVCMLIYASAHVGECEVSMYTYVVFMD